ncbi:hypothetical protein [Actinoplanes sp. DH11]|uniref:hypothetical protein n=1 Tax=Actinoplanes sp. DH11 TaxID=2857011 RepID=UPI001E362EC9|nr:hypothetical protein [Actinoplanes sp. DH11]
MTSRILRLVPLAVAAVVLVLFLGAQRQDVEVSYRAPAPATQFMTESAGLSGSATVPTVAEMTAAVRAAPVVRLPGSIAHWDEARVRAAIGDSGYRILVAPPGLSEEERARVRDVEPATIRVIGTEVSGDIWTAVPDRISGWRTRFATGDVTGSLVAVIAKAREQQQPDAPDTLTRREPTAAEIGAVVADLRRTGMHRAPGTTLAAQLPAKAGTAFGGAEPLVVALPQQPFGQPMPRFGPALTAEFPGRPVIVMYGQWVEYDGPGAEGFDDVAAASFYSQFNDRMSRSAYPQTDVLGLYLWRISDIRYAGLFDRPLPFQPFDPLRVALPALPWVFAGCVLTFFLLSATSLLRSPRRVGTPGSAGPAAQLAGLAALAVEMSALTDKHSEPALARALTALSAAREALDHGLPASHVRKLLAKAERDLDDAGRRLPYRGYRPDDYLRGRLT